MARKKDSRAEFEGLERYLQQASKMIPWPVDIYDKAIDVPDNEIDLAKDDLTVMHLCNKFGFKLQICLPEEVEKKPVFNPELSQYVRPEIVKPAAITKVGDCYRVNGGVQVEVTRIVDDTVYTKAIGQMTSESPIGFKTLELMLKRETWVRL